MKTTMLRNAVIRALLACALPVVYAFAPGSFSRSYDAGATDFGECVIEYGAGGYAFAGTTRKKNSFHDDAFVAFVNAKGRAARRYTFGGKKNDSFSSIAGRSDGTFFCAGSSEREEGGVFDMYFVKIDQKGTPLFERRYPGEGSAWCSDMAITDDDGAALAGYTLDQANVSRGYIIRVDKHGRILWAKEYGDTGNDLAHAIMQTKDGGFIVAGETKAKGRGDTDAFLMKINATGGVVWKKNFGGRQNDMFSDVIELAEGGYVATGLIVPENETTANAYLVMASDSGALRWQSSYGGRDFDAGASVVRAETGGFVVAGYTYSMGKGDRDMYLFAVDAKGELLWEQTYGGRMRDEANSLIATLDGGYALLGTTVHLETRKSELFFVKTDAEGK